LTARKDGTPNQTNQKEKWKMTKVEMLAKIELLNRYEAMMEEIKAEADSIRNTIKAEMEAREVEELIAGQYIIRWTSVLSNRFDSTAFKKVMPELYKAYTKQTASRRFSISA
jgi:predicted phage-related endonuclease